MSEKLTDKEIELLQYYQKKKKTKKIIMIVVLIVVALCFFLYVGYNVYSQTYWEVKEEKISIEYGEKYEPVLGALVDTNIYSFITLDNTTITSNIEKEKDKEYLAIGEYEVTISNNGKINLFGFEKAYNSEKKVLVVVKDTTPPTIKAPEIIEMLVGESLDMERYLYLFETKDLSETKKLELDASDVNNNLVGNYTIMATIEDIYGNKQTCNVPCSVIKDPYGDIGIVENTTTETTTKKAVAEQETTKPTEIRTTTVKSEENVPKVTTKSENNKTTKKEKATYTSKDFLFKDGYTMANVSDAAIDYLKKSGKAGECVPLKDKDGIYIGMRVIIYD